MEKSYDGSKIILLFGSVMFIIMILFIFFGEQRDAQEHTKLLSIENTYIQYLNDKKIGDTIDIQYLSFGKLCEKNNKYKKYIFRTQCIWHPIFITIQNNKIIAMFQDYCIYQHTIYDKTN